MKYLGTPAHDHTAQAVAGVLFVNLGTPDAPETGAVRRYLAEFLSDPRVIEVPTLLWRLILHSIILRIRPRRSAAAYRAVWQAGGSPLLLHTRAQAELLQQCLNERCAGPVHVEPAMRYGRPSITEGLERLRMASVRRLLLLPLYPQYSATTTASTFDAVTSVLRHWRWLPEFRMVLHYHDRPLYIEALATTIREFRTQHETGERLLFSFHGIPRHYFLAGDPYHCECHKTARLTATALGLKDDQWAVSFQSRLGPRKWLQPYTDVLLTKWAKSGVRKVDVICPGFAADCLETLEEVRLRYHELYVEAGGEKLNYIPALNEHPRHITMLTELVTQHADGWPEFAAAGTLGETVGERQARQERAKRIGASR